MNRDVWIALLSVVSGGGVAGVITAMQAAKKGKREDIDGRILAWQQISDKHEQRMERMERKLEAMERYIADLERYNLALEKIILRLDPSAEIPPRPSRTREHA